MIRKYFGPELLVLTLLLVGLDAFAFYKLQQATNADKTLNEVIVTTNAVRDIHRLLAEAETGQRGYLLTGREEYLEPYEDAIRTIDGVMTRLSHLLGQNHSEVRTLRRLARDKMEELAETIRLRRYHTQHEAVKVVNTDRGRKVMKEIRELTNKLRTQQEMRAAEYTENLDSTLEFMKYLRAAHTLLAVVLGGVLVGVYRRVPSPPER
jgi:CHASE3 domain sensor protein